MASTTARHLPADDPSSEASNARLRLAYEHDGSGEADRAESPARASGTSTPIPKNAPPSVQATASVRKAAKEKRRLFPSVRYEARVSHFDPRSEHRDFRGFYTLFWIGLAIMVITTGLRNMREHGYPLTLRQKDTFLANIWELAFSDLIMCATCYLNLPLQGLYRGTSILRWRAAGVWVQSAFQFGWLFFWVQWPFLRSWTWTSQVTFLLHSLVLLMKVHSYAFYNGHLAETSRRLKELDKELLATDQAPSPARRGRVNRYPSSTVLLEDMKKHSFAPDASKKPLDELNQLRDDLAVELTSPMGRVSYPANLTALNFTDFLFCPTLCYELEYPRDEKIRLFELFAKGLAVFGCVFLLTLVADEFIIPVLDEGAFRLMRRQTLIDGLLILAETTSRLLFPFMVTFLLVFLVIFEFLLGFFAELTCFADRHFYDDWWNSGDWLTFSREWNVPVHNFLRRHVYAALSHSGSTSKSVALVVTFLVSALGHELIMGCITKKLRGYGFVAMMLQIPIVVVQRSKLMRSQTLLNNVLFWCSMCLGLAMMCALYVLV